MGLGVIHRDIATRSTSSALVYLPSLVAIPTLKVTGRDACRSRWEPPGWSASVRRSDGSRWARCCEATPRTRRHQSALPDRPVLNRLGNGDRSGSAASPARWPVESLTSLNPSRSRNTTAYRSADGARASLIRRKPLQEQLAIRQARHLVVQRGLPELLLELLARLDVVDRSDDARRRAFGGPTGNAQHGRTGRCRRC